MINNRNLNRQGGAVLVVCMIVLLMLTLIGISGARGVIMQEKMTFASKDAQLALQVAETAVRAAEVEIDALTAPDVGFTATGPLYLGGSAPADLLAATSWVDTVSRSAEITMGEGAAAQPFTWRYFIEQAGQLAPPAGSSETGSCYGCPPSTPPTIVFRIVARGQGLAGTERIIVTHHGKQF